MKHIIEISRDRLKPSDEYRASELNNRNPLLLWKAIKKLHTTKMTGDIVGERQIQRERIKKIKQYNTESFKSF